MKEMTSWRITALTAAVISTSAAACGTRTEGKEQSAEAVKIEVFKTATCGCCKSWVDHLRENGFSVAAEDVNDRRLREIKGRLGVTLEISACHTAIVDGYVIEGHVPADVIQRLLKERPEIRGLAVPGMPAGSPGMEGPYEERYDVLAFDEAGNTTVYESR